MTPELSIIMCAYNEMGRIQLAIDDVITAASVGGHESFEIIILDNGSTDGTREWLATLHLDNVSVILNEANLGKGGSVKTGIQMSRGRYVVIHDSDGEYLASDIWDLLDVAKNGGLKMVLGSRWLGGNASYLYFSNYIGVKCLTFLTNLLYRSRLTDAATALKLFEGEVVRRLRLQSSGFSLDFELVARMSRLGYKIGEIRVDYFPRSKEDGKKVRSFRDGLLSLGVIFRDRILPLGRFTNF